MTTPHKPFAQYAYRSSADQAVGKTARHPVVIIGAGPVGLALAIDLAQRGLKPIVLDDSDRIGDGSRAICFAKRTLEVFDRLGMAKPALDKGVEWQKGRVFHRDAELYTFDLLPEPGHKMPAFINIQQFYVEKFLVDRVLATGRVDLRWRNQVTALEPHATHVGVTIETPEGPYTIDADWVVACDGARSPSRAMLRLDFAGEQFEEQFLIADVKMTAAFPTERWFWFEPPFHDGQSTLLHKQPDDIWRIDMQLSPTADAEHERRPEIVRPRIEKMLGHKNFELEWVSIYRFQCRRIERFVHGRVVFAGDSAHQVSPFGARGANSGIQDAENLAWKLAAVLDGASPATLIESYNAERVAAADENIAHSTRSTDFIAPQSPAEKVLRDATLALAPKADFAKRMINPGRLSTASAYAASPLSTGDSEDWAGGAAPGTPAPDVPLADRNGRSCYLSEALGQGFTLLVRAPASLDAIPAGVSLLAIGEDGAFRDAEALFAARYDAQPGSAYLVRPDTHVAARFKSVTPAKLAAALAKARGQT